MDLYSRFLLKLLIITHEVIIMLAVLILIHVAVQFKKKNNMFKLTFTEVINKWIF